MPTDSLVIFPLGLINKSKALQLMGFADAFPVKHYGLSKALLTLAWVGLLLSAAFSPVLG